jgi:hypothetical protein
MTGNTDDEPAYSWFQRMRTDVDELLRLRKRAAQTLSRAPSTFNGLAAFLDAILPRDPDAENRIARAIHIHPESLQQFRRRELNPAEVPPESLAILGRTASLDWHTFDVLVVRDLTWFAKESPLAMLRDNTADPAQVRSALHVAWLRDAIDDPTTLPPE